MFSWCKVVLEGVLFGVSILLYCRQMDDMLKAKYGTPVGFLKSIHTFHAQTNTQNV